MNSIPEDVDEKTETIFLLMKSEMDLHHNLSFREELLPTFF